MRKKINRKQNLLAGSVFKLWYVFVAKLKYYYHRLLHRTLVGSVHYSAHHPHHPSSSPFGEEAVQHYKSKIYTTTSALSLRSEFLKTPQ